MKVRMFLSLKIIVVLFVAACSLRAQEAKNSTGSNYNPVIPDCIADPSVVMFDDTFYLYATTDIDEGLSRMGIPVVWKSTDFVNWSFEGSILTDVDWNKPYTFTDNKGKEKTGYFRYWAPGKPIRENGKIYLLATIVKPDESMGTYVLIADSPEGPFHFATGSGSFFNDSIHAATETKPLIPDIDGEPFIDDNGEAYVCWRRRFASKLSDDMLSLEGATISIPTKFSGYSEGPLLFKRDSLYYYLYTLSGHANYCYGYMISHTSPLGPYEEPQNDNIFIHSSIENSVWGPGHGNVFQLPGTDEFIFLYLEYGEGGTTRQVFANRMNFNNDGTIAPIIPDNKGVGALGNKPDQRINIALEAKTTASSCREKKAIKSQIIPDPNTLASLQVSTRDGEPVERTFTYEAQNATDGSNGSRWWAADNDSIPWLQIDLGETKTIQEVDLYFIFPTQGQAWTLEKSTDGENWTVCSAQKEKKACSPHVTNSIVKARYLRVTITDGKKGLYEVKIY